MTDSSSFSAAPGAGAWVPLVRPRGGRVLRGVCAGLGHATRTDPVLWRVLVVVLALFGGSGIALYLAGWFLAPAEGEERSAAQRLLGDRAAVLSAGLLVVLACLATVVLGVGADGDQLVPLVVIGVLAYLVVRNRQEDGGLPVATGVPASAAPEAVMPPVPVAARRRWGRLELLAASGAAVVGGGVLLAGELGVDGVTAPRAVAASLLVVGAGLLAGASGRRSRRLVPLAVVLLLALGVSTAARGVDPSAGERTWLVTTSAEHQLGIGSARLDLTPLGAAAGEVDVRADLGMGELVVLVPDDVRAELRLRVGAGELDVVDLDGGTVMRDGTGLERTTWIGPPDGRVVRVEARVGFGHLEVRRVGS